MKAVKSSVPAHVQKNGIKKDRNDDKLSTKIELSVDDPLSSVLTIIDKRLRSLEKRRAKAQSLQQLASEGKTLNEDQMATASHLGEIVSKIEFAKDIQEHFSLMHAEFLKSKKGLSGNFSDPVANARNDAVISLTTAMDVIPNAQLYIEKLCIINTGRDEPLSKADLNIVVKFKRLLDSSPKKAQLHYQSLVSRSDKLINKDINVTYGQLMELILKINKMIQLNSVSTKDPGQKKAEKPQVTKQNGFKEAETELPSETKDAVELPPIEIVELVDKTENMWQDYTRTSEKKGYKDKKPDPSHQFKSIAEQNIRTGRRRTEKPFRGNDVFRVTNEGTKIIVRDNPGREFDKNSSRGYRDIRTNNRGFDGGNPQQNVPENGLDEHSSRSRRRDQYPTGGVGNFSGPRNGNFRGNGNLRGRYRGPQEHSPSPVVS